MTITLPTLRFYAYHGVLPQERKVGGDYELTLHLQIDNDDAYEALCYDELEGTVNYAEAYELVKQEMEKPSQLLEHVVARVARALIRGFSKVREVQVDLTKCAPPIHGFSGRGASVSYSLRRKLFAWDFDGTIGDTHQGIVRTMSETFRQKGFPVPSAEAICRTIGLPLATSIEQLSGRQGTIIDKAVTLYRQLFEKIGCDGVTIFPSVAEEMRREHELGYFVGIATSRGHVSVEELCNQLGILPYIDFIVACEDVAAHKPNPDPVLRLNELTHTLPIDTTIVGDTTYDIEMGVNAGATHLIGVSWGNHTPQMLRDAGATQIVMSFEK